MHGDRLVVERCCAFGCENDPSAEGIVAVAAVSDLALCASVL